MPANASGAAPWNAAVVSVAMRNPAMILLNGRLARIVDPAQMHLGSRTAKALLRQSLALKWKRMVAGFDGRTITADAMPAVADRADPRGSLDPDDWSGLRASGHRMLDDVFNELQD